jgi:alpha-beta hydrolase superfamily lysophospholipase
MTPIAILITLFVLYVATLVFMAWVSVHPMRIPIFFSPGALGVAQEPVELVAADGVRMAGWWVPTVESRGVIVLAHGYMMNRAEPSVLAAWLAGQGWSCLLMDFPGHGSSGQRRVGFGWTERNDVAVMLREARKRADGAPVVAWGSSMGAAASAFALAEDGSLADGLVLDSAYGSLVGAVSGWWYWLGGRKLQIILGPVIWFGRMLLPFNPNRVRVSDALRNVHVPTLLLHGDRDSLATPDQAEQNLAALGEQGKLVWFAGCAHSEGRWVHPVQYQLELKKYLDEVEKNFRRA